MKLILFLWACLHVVYSRPQNDKKSDIISYNFDLKESGSFSYNFKTKNGIRHDVQGELKNIGTAEEGLSVKGSYFYIAPDGSIYNVQYVADEKGFQPIIKIDSPTGTRTGQFSCTAATLCGTGLG